MTYRYRDNAGSTSKSIARFDRALSKLGAIRYIRGYRYIGRYGVSHEAVIVRGEHGSARFGGLLWGYSGEGPRGLATLLVRLGYDRDRAWDIAVNTPRLDALGEDWRIAFD